MYCKGGEKKGTMVRQNFNIFPTSLYPAVVSERKETRLVLTFLALGVVFFVLILPLITVFVSAFNEGFVGYIQSLFTPENLSAIRLTLIVAFISIPLNVIFGVAAAWTIAKFEFFGKRFLISLIDLPFSVSPVVSGLVFVLLFGANGLFGSFLTSHDIKIIFAVPGIIITTVFVTFPFVARELIPLMQAQGNEEEEASLTLGANGWQTFFLVTLPNIRWGMLYGVILLNARAMGEFGAVSVVSGHIQGLTTTMPLQVEILYNEYNFVGAFSVASLLGFLALATLVLKALIERKTHHEHSS